MFKVLVIAYYFPPLGLSGVQRTLKFVKYLPQYNWQPTVLTTGKTAYYAHDDSLLDELKGKDIKIVRVQGSEINSLFAKKGTVKMPAEIIRKTLSRISSFFFIPDNKNGWSQKAYPVAKELLTKEDYDLIFVTGPPFSTVNLAVKLKKEFNIPLVVDYRDLWFGYQFGFYATPLHKYLIKKMEYNALKIADKITVTNRRIKEKLMDYYKFLSHNEVVIITHGFDPEDFEKAGKIERHDDKCIITYSGIFYEFITPKYFLKAFKEISVERPDIAGNIELHFVGILRKENKRFIKKLGLQNFVVEHGYVNHAEAVKKLVASDILWLMVGYGRNVETHSAGKLFEYFGSEKPIIACLPEGALRSAVEEYGSSFIADPENIAQIKECIYKAYEFFRLKKLPKPNYEFVEKHRRDYLTDQLSKEFQFLVKVR
jgi:glycosyltransferase involved in cell wall biosynthesis